MCCPVRHCAKRAGPGGHSSNRRAKLGGTAPEPSPPQAAEVAEDGEGGGRGPRGPRSPGGAAAPQGAPTPPRRLRSCAAAPGGERDLPRNRRGRSRRKAPPPRTRRGHQRRSAPPPTQTHQRARAEGLDFSRARNERKQAEQSAGRGGKRAAEGEARSAPQRASPRRARRRPATRNPDGSRRWLVGWLDGCRRAAARLTPANQRAAARNPREGNSDTRAGANKRNWPRAQRRKCAVRPQGGCRWEPPFPPLNVPLGAERQRGRGGEGGREAQAGGEGAGARKRRQQGGTNRKTRTLSRRSRQQPRFFLLDFPRFSLLTAL